MRSRTPPLCAYGDNGRARGTHALQLGECLSVFGNILGSEHHASITEELLRPVAMHATGLNEYYDVFLRHRHAPCVAFKVPFFPSSRFFGVRSIPTVIRPVAHGIKGAIAL